MTDPRPHATAVPTTTGTADAGSVRGRAPATQGCAAAYLIGRAAHTERKLAAVPDLVAIDLPGGPAFVAALRAGLGRRRRRAARSTSGCRARATRPVLDQLRPARHRARRRRDAASVRRLPVEAGDALVVATSGTTGRPEGRGAHPRRRARRRRGPPPRRLGVDPARHRWLACLPLNHVGGLSVVTRA